MGAKACARDAKAIAAAIAQPFLSGCAGLHLDQGPDQVIQRTEGEDNYAERQKAGPVAARVLPYALLAEQSYDPNVYATHTFTPRASACGGNGAADCDARADDERAARWLYEFGEVLAYGRLIMLHTIPLSPCNPRVVSVRFRVFQGAPIALHSLTDLDNGLLRVARGSEPERSPMVLERCGATLQPPLVASQ